MAAALEESPSIKPSRLISTMPSIYDTYLCKELLSRSPLLGTESEDNHETRLRTLQSSAGYFLKQDRIRAVERLQLETAREYMREKEWGNAIKVLRPLWQTLSWRQAGWWRLVEVVDWALRECARMVGDGDILIAVEWELMSRSLAERPGWQYDFSKSLKGLAQFDKRPKAIVRSGNIRSCLSATFAFLSSQGYVGKRLSAQLVISSLAQQSSAPIKLTQVDIIYKGNLKNVRILHDPKHMPDSTTKDELLSINSILLRQTDAAADEPALSKSTLVSLSQFLAGECDLRFTPGITKVLIFDVTPRAAGDLEAGTVTLSVEEKDFDFQIVVTDNDLRQQNIWCKGVVEPIRKIFGNESSNVVKILPKPPKMRIEVLSFKRSYFADELIAIEIHVINDEDSDANIMLEVRLLGHSENFPVLEWLSDEEGSTIINQDIHDEGVNHYQGKLLITPIGQLASIQTRKAKISLQAGPEAAEYVLEVKALYRLLTDPDTPITKATEVDLLFIKPFEVNYNLSPRTHPGCWPNYFYMENDNDDTNSTLKEVMSAEGISQNWSLTTRIKSLGTESIRIESVILQVLGKLNDVICKITHAGGPSHGMAVIMPADVERLTFGIEVQKYRLEDSQSTVLHLQLEIRWRRESALASSTITNIAVPELVIPFGEPRVLAVARNALGTNRLIHLEYTVENPSMYVLAFNVTMETSEEFVFSGAKATTLQLVPLSRYTVQYHLLPLVRGKWISPLFRVVDVHFNKTLTVHATDGMRSDAKGTFIWVEDDS